MSSTKNVASSSDSDDDATFLQQWIVLLQRTETLATSNGMDDTAGKIDSLHQFNTVHRERALAYFHKKATVSGV
jgi:hypothetical protein